MNYILTLILCCTVILQLTFLPFLKPRTSTNCAWGYFRMTVCRKAIALEISTVYKYVHSNYILTNYKKSWKIRAVWNICRKSYVLHWLSCRLLYESTFMWKLEVLGYCLIWLPNIIILICNSYLVAIALFCKHLFNPISHRSLGLSTLKLISILETFLFLFKYLIW